MPLAAALLLAALPLAPAGASPSATVERAVAASRAPAPVPVVLRIGRGRALLAEGDGPVRLATSAAGALELAEPVFLELGVGARAEVRWPGRASLRLEGPAVVSWAPAPLDPSETGGPVRCEVVQLGSAEVEVRRGGLALGFERDRWDLAVGRGALHLAGQPDGALELRHHGGKDVRVRTRVLRPPGTWPAVVRAGARVRLPAAP